MSDSRPEQPAEYTVKPHVFNMYIPILNLTFNCFVETDKCCTYLHSQKYNILSTEKLDDNK